MCYQSYDHQQLNTHILKCVKDQYFECYFQIYPVISKLLQILITLLVTTYTGERQFCTLR